LGNARSIGLVLGLITIFAAAYLLWVGGGPAASSAVITFSGGLLLAATALRKCKRASERSRLVHAFVWHTSLVTAAAALALLFEGDTHEMWVIPLFLSVLGLAGLFFALRLRKASRHSYENSYFSD
jgi:hypothetical protein